MGAHAEFVSLQNSIERMKWLNMTPVWVERPLPKEEVRQKSKGNGNRTQHGRDMDQNSIVKLQLRVVEICG